MKTYLLIFPLIIILSIGLLHIQNIYIYGQNNFMASTENATNNNGNETGQQLTGVPDQQTGGQSKMTDETNNANPGSQSITEMGKEESPEEMREGGGQSNGTDETGQQLFGNPDKTDNANPTSQAPITGLNVEDDEAPNIRNFTELNGTGRYSSLPG
jgi:hypothetical protein